MIEALSSYVQVVDVRKCDEMEKAGNDSKKVFSLVKELTQKTPVSFDVINDTNSITLVSHPLRGQISGVEIINNNNIKWSFCPLPLKFQASSVILKGPTPDP